MVGRCRRILFKNNFYKKASSLKYFWLFWISPILLHLSLLIVLCIPFSAACGLWRTSEEISFLLWRWWKPWVLNGCIWLPTASFQYWRIFFCLIYCDQNVAFAYNVGPNLGFKRQSRFQLTSSTRHLKTFQLSFTENIWLWCLTELWKTFWKYRF